MRARRRGGDDRVLNAAMAPVVMPGAELLVVSPKTVGRHVENLYRKLGVSSRAAAAVFAMEHHLLD